MKKFVLMMACLFLVCGTSIAQDKEALKAQKAAMKEAASTLKKAKNTYDMSIPNEQYGRKETDFEKLSTARELIESAMQNQYSKDDADTWETASNIFYEYYKKQENEVKADPDNEKIKADFLALSIKLLNISQIIFYFVSDFCFTNHIHGTVGIVQCPNHRILSGISGIYPFKHQMINRNIHFFRIILRSL